MTSAHDKALARLRRAARSLSLADAADAFLASLSTRQLQWRAPLEAVVMERHLPAHQYHKQTTFSSGDTCAVCGYDEIEEEYGHSPGRLASFIEDLGKSRPHPTAADLAAFGGILKAVKEQQRQSIDGRVRRAELVKALSPVFKSDKYERMEVLNALGRCSVLAPAAHPGFLRAFRNWEDRAEGSGNNEFDWPFSQWTAADGFDATAVRELFPQRGLEVPEQAPPRGAFDEPVARAEVERLSQKLRGRDQVERVVFAPGGLWIAQLKDGRFALLYKIARRWRWVTGGREDVIASVPDTLFSEAVAALRGA